MCRHAPAPMFPAPDTDARRAMWRVRALADRVRCQTCGLTGRRQRKGTVKWHRAGSVGHADAEMLAGEWEAAGDRTEDDGR